MPKSGSGGVWYNANATFRKAIVRPTSTRPHPPMGPRPAAARPRPRVRAVAAPPPPPRRRRRQTGQTSEFEAERVTLGRRPKNTFRQLSKFVRSNISQSVFAFENVSRFGGANGAVGMINAQTALGTTLYTPLHAYDLTSVLNGRAGAIITPITGQWLTFSDETAAGVANWRPLGFNFRLEQSPASSTIQGNYPGNTSVLKWAQAKMMFYAPLNVPSKITVSFVQFTDRELCPDTRTAVNTVLTTRASAWYQNYMKRSMFSPICVNEPGGFKGIKTLHTETFILNPKETTEATTHYKQLDIFKWFNRKCTYDWDQTQGASPEDAVPSVEQGLNQNTVHEKARIFLLINCQSGYKSTGIALDNTMQPSYDLILRTAHEQLAT